MTLIVTPVILSGGAGTRLWPLSHDGAPKQFHALASDKTMLQDTALRTLPADDITFRAPVVICSAAHVDTIKAQLADVSLTPSRIVLEPFGRNTAAAAQIAAAVVEEMEPGSLVLLLPADHVVSKPQAFRAAISRAAATAQSHIVTFGIEPTGPETGYGYIQQGAPLDDGVFKVSRFAEKPSKDVAAAYLAGGDYSWNAGIFLFSPKVMLQEMQRYAPEIAQASVEALTKGASTDGVVLLDRDVFASCPSEPVDIAVMEKTALAAVAPVDMGWADVGSWSELHRLGPADANGNLLHGAAVAIDSHNALIWSDGPPIAVIGMSDVIVVSTPQGLIVAPLDRAQDVKLAVAGVKALSAK